MKRRYWAIGAIGVIAAGIWVAYSVMQDLSRVEKGEHVANLSWLPSDASDISFYGSYLETAAEFRISEADFKRWCQRKGYQLEVISGKPLSIRRYSANDARVRENELANAPQTDETLAELEALRGTEDRRVSHGLFYRKEFGNGGGAGVAFDSDSQMGYYESSPR